MVNRGRLSRRSTATLALALAALLGLPASRGRAAQAPAPERPAPARAELVVFAAASLADALTEIARAWEKAAGMPVVLSFGASSDLARQIRAGAPADVFVSADAAQMDALERAGLVRAADRADLVSNTLVVVVPADSTASVASARDLARFETIALADPQAVPAGVYAREWLSGLGLWDQLSPRVVPMLHVRAALAAVESGHAEAGIVYRTDAAAASRSRIALEVPADEGPRIVYPAAPLRTSRKLAAPSFVGYLKSAHARAVLARHGFLPLGDR